MRKRYTVRNRNLVIHPISHRHLKFLLNMWNDPEIMRYAGSERNWSLKDIKRWYVKYKERFGKYGNTETHFIIKLKDGKLIGESGLGRMKKGWSCPHYKSPKNKLAVMADIKLLKPFWNKGFGTQAMKAIVRYVFKMTDTDIFLVPPHRENLPAIKVYEKARFKRTKGIYYRHHLVYQMRKRDFLKIYQ
jgi:ribosomal-protein-alanine N-acetyltransferase